MSQTPTWIEIVFNLFWGNRRVISKKVKRFYSVIFVFVTAVSPLSAMECVQMTLQQQRQVQPIQAAIQIRLTLNPKAGIEKKGLYISCLPAHVLSAIFDSTNKQTERIMKTLLKNKLTVKRMTVVNLSGPTRKTQGRLSYPTTGTMSLSR